MEARPKKALIVYDSQFGNTERIAKAIGDAIGGEIQVVRPGEVSSTELESMDLVIVGSPTQGGRPLKATQEFLGRIPTDALKNVRVASFDTRLKTRLVKIFGYAAGRITDGLVDKGGCLAVPPEGFFVKGGKGPLDEGELERAATWARGITESK